MTAAVQSAVGFRAQLSGASLWDLVQMECQARSRLVVRVKGEGDWIPLFRGRAGDPRRHPPIRSGTRRPRWRILSWTSSLFQPCDREWPAAARTIQAPCGRADPVRREALATDEGASNVVAFPGRVGADPTEELPFDEVQILEFGEEGMADMRSPNIDQPSPAVPLARTELTVRSATSRS